MPFIIIRNVNRSFAWNTFIDLRPMFSDGRLEDIRVRSYAPSTNSDQMVNECRGMRPVR